MKFLLKFLLIAALCGMGIYLLMTGVGIPISFIKFKGFEGHQIPAGAFLLVMGVLVAMYWKIEEKTTIETTTTKTWDDGAKTTTTTTVEKTDKSFKGPWDS